MVFTYKEREWKRKGLEVKGRGGEARIARRGEEEKKKKGGEGGRRKW